MKDGKLVKDAFMAVVKMIADGDATKTKAGEEVMGACEGITDGDRCEMAYKLSECFMTEGHKRKMEYGL